MHPENLPRLVPRIPRIGVTIARVAFIILALTQNSPDKYVGSGDKV